MSPPSNTANAAGLSVGGGSQWLPRRPSKRSKLRNGTFIIPATGERSRRQFTLRNAAWSTASSGSASRDNNRNRDADGDSDNSLDDENDGNSASFFTAPGFSAHTEGLGRWAAAGWVRFRTWSDSPKGRGVLKCVVAYTIASFWTFWPPLSSLLGNLDGKHMVATITVYFHPARSAGSMIEATAIGVVAVAYAVVISIMSMAASVFFGSVLGWVVFGHMVVLVFFIGVAFGFIGWVKQRLNNPSVNVGCTLASLAITTVVTKENATYTSVFSNTKIVQVLKILVFGICTTSSVSLLLWRVSARALLRESLTQASNSLGDMLAMITHGFLSGAEEELTVSAEYRAAAAGWAASHSKMTKNLSEAKYEHYAVGHARLYQLEKAVYKSMETLAQSIGGLRSAANTQFELLRESAAMMTTTSTTAAVAVAGTPGTERRTELTGTPLSPTLMASPLLVSPTMTPMGSPSPVLLPRPALARASSSFQRSGRLAMLSAIDEASDESSEDRPGQTAVLAMPARYIDDGAVDDSHRESAANSVGMGSSSNGAVLIQFGDSDGANGSGPPSLNNSRRSSIAGLPLRTPSEIFELFISMLGPSMKSLAFTLAGVLRDPPFGTSPHYNIITLNHHYRQSLTDALVLFNTARADALQELYKTIELGRASSSRSNKIKAADFEEVAAACGHFSFSLQTFGEEMTKYLDVLDDLKLVNDHNRRSWRWLLFWKPAQSRFPSVLPFDSPDRDDDGEGNGSRANDSTVRPIRKSQLPRGIPDHMVQRRDTFSWHAAPQTNAVVRNIAQDLLKILRKLTRDDIRFGIKVGIGAVLWAMMAFIPKTRDTYMHWRGEWGLLSFMIVCSMTLGASNTTAVARFLATLMGATWAIASWNISQGHALPLLVLGWFVALGGFYVMIDRGKAPLGRTTLLAYNVITLYAYSLSQRVDDDDDDEGGVHPFIMEIAKHRFLAVTAGILWGLFICRVVWPISARVRFKEGLSVLYLQMGLIWKRGPLAILLRSDCTRSYLKTGEQAALQRYATRLETLRQSAASEFELRGPFPSEASGRVLAASNRVLDGFYAMSLLTQIRRQRRVSPRIRRDGEGGCNEEGSGYDDPDSNSSLLTPGERALLYYTATERAMLCDRICHVFQVLASSFMLEYPLTNALPGVTVVRDRLLAKIFQFRKEHAMALEAADGGRQSDQGGGGKSDEGQDVVPDAATLPPAASGTTTPSPITGHGNAVLTVPVEERDYALLYAYALITGQVAEELKLIEKEVEGLFGVLDEEALLLQ